MRVRGVSDLRIAAAICVAYGDLYETGDVSVEDRPSQQDLLERAHWMLVRSTTDLDQPSDEDMRGGLAKLVDSGIYTIDAVSGEVSETKTGVLLLNRITRNTNISTGAKFLAVEAALRVKFGLNPEPEDSFAARMRARRKRGK